MYVYRLHIMHITAVLFFPCSGTGVRNMQETAVLQLRTVQPRHKQPRCSKLPQLWHIPISRKICYLLAGRTLFVNVDGQHGRGIHSSVGLMMS